MRLWYEEHCCHTSTGNQYLQLGAQVIAKNLSQFYDNKARGQAGSIAETLQLAKTLVKDNP